MTGSEAIVHTVTEIDALLRRGLTPITDNRSALVELGFERAYPQIARGHDSTIWERTVNAEARSQDGKRMWVRQRAFLETGSR